MPTHHTLSPNPSSVHWGYLDAKIPPRLTIESGDTVTIETVSGGPADVGDTSIMLPHQREICEKLKPTPGPHILTGPVAVRGAEPGDTLEVRIKAIEPCLTGTFELVLHKNKPLDMPRAVTTTHYITMGLDPDLDDAAKQALRDMIRWLVEMKGWSSEEAYVFCSLACDLRVTQLVD